MRIVIVTGMSGAGKTTALKMLEDMGFYCVDNLPIRLIEKFVELIRVAALRQMILRWALIFVILSLLDL